jgi:hypothetical protein
MPRKIALCAALGLSLALAACGGDTELTSVDAFLKENEGFPKVRPDGRLTADPPALTEKNVADQPKDSARRLVIQLWYLAQAGHPDVVSLYEPAVQRSVGLPNLIGAYSLARSLFAVSWPRIVQEVPGNGATTVKVLAFTKGAPPVGDTFVLRRRGSRWLIAYDSLLARSLESYVQEVHDPGARKPSQAAKAAGLEAAKTYRDGFARTLEPGGRRAFIPQLKAEEGSAPPDATGE